MDCKTAQSLVIPYIKNELDDEELEDFLNHIKNCKECYEELEIHFTIQYALKKLDEDERVSFDMPVMLKENLKAAQSRVTRRRILHCAASCIMAAAELLLLLTLLIQMELIPNRPMGESRLYQTLSFEKTEEATEIETDTEEEIKMRTSTEKNADTEKQTVEDKNTDMEKQATEDKSADTEKGTVEEKSTDIERHTEI